MQRNHIAEETQRAGLWSQPSAEQLAGYDFILHRSVLLRCGRVMCAVQMVCEGIMRL